VTTETDSRGHRASSLTRKGGRTVERGA
jgi:hypothetical protein